MTWQIWHLLPLPNIYSSGLYYIYKEQICVNSFLDQGLEPSWKAIKRKTGEIARASKFPVPASLQTPHAQPTPISAFLSFTTKKAERFSKRVADQWREVWWLREHSPQKVLGFCFFLFLFFSSRGRGVGSLKPPPPPAASRLHRFCSSQPNCITLLWISLILQSRDEKQWKGLCGKYFLFLSFLYTTIVETNICILLTFESAMGTKLSCFCSDDLNSFSFSPKSLRVQSFCLSL